MVDLCAWRARIGLFCGKMQAGRMSAQVSEVLGDSRQAVTVTDVVIAYAACCILMLLLLSVAENIAAYTYGVNIGVLAENFKGRGTTFDAEGVHTNVYKECAGVCQLALHTPTVLSSLCAAQAVLTTLRLLRSGDVEMNPGPVDLDEKKVCGACVSDSAEETVKVSAISQDVTQDILKAIRDQGQQHRQQTDAIINEQKLIRSDLGEIKSELTQVREKCEQISERCDSLEKENSRLATAVKDLSSDMSQLFDDGAERKEETKRLADVVDNLSEHVASLNSEIDKLEEFSRRDNLRIFGIQQSNDRENYDKCVEMVTQCLNSVEGPKRWSESDIERAHRVGQARDDKPRPMLVKFRQWKDKIGILTDRSYRDRLDAKGIRVANDLTRRQSQIVHQARLEGKAAFFVKGKLTVSDRRQDSRTYAAVAAEQNLEHTTTHVFLTSPQKGNPRPISVQQQARRATVSEASLRRGQQTSLSPSEALPATQRRNSERVSPDTRSAEGQGPTTTSPSPLLHQSATGTRGDPQKKDTNLQNKSMHKCVKQTGLHQFANPNSVASNGRPRRNKTK